ncbi:voltage-gated chloride channel family protein [Mucilaginibacter flavus]|uniref:voltage-gated chloride channel family protein n=1 Tax=Mucilaginibacter flavus TaxID=931504 RepID=UPI0025B431EA|nr:voltage-gated chloride channel family protein [Mucilaginibacter flavus]MDN3579502.1 voltage-gated chloride channel family protein [Mucilaginibacter flavus]
MKDKLFASDYFLILKSLLRWTLIIIPIAIAIGSMVALFLWLLTWAIHFRFKHTWLLYLLPVAGVLIHYIYKLVGKTSEKGNNLIIDEIHQPGGGVPKRMAPIVLLTTIITHLFGGSAGREGTAVQIGGSIAQAFGKWFNLNEADTRIVLTAGIAAGFGAVFGTPLTGAIFAMEVLTIGRIQYNALLPCLIAAIIADVTVGIWGVHHTQYHITAFAAVPHWLSGYTAFDFVLLFKIIIASVAFGLASYLFAFLVHGLKSMFVKNIPKSWLIPVLGGLIIIGLTAVIGKPDYLSLGVDAEHAGAVTIPSAFNTGGADTWSWLWKTIYTTVTLSTGFKGGEVTPLFYIGATLGNTLSVLMDAPVSLFAALGFIAVFAGATNTPVACTFMGIELFGGQYALFFAVACFTAYFFSGHSGIYGSQYIGVAKTGEDGVKGTLSEVAKQRQSYARQKLEKYRFKKD